MQLWRLRSPVICHLQIGDCRGVDQTESRSLRILDTNHGDSRLQTVHSPVQAAALKFTSGPGEWTRLLGLQGGQ